MATFVVASMREGAHTGTRETGSNANEAGEEAGVQKHQANSFEDNPSSLSKCCMESMSLGSRKDSCDVWISSKHLSSSSNKEREPRRSSHQRWGDNYGVWGLKTKGTKEEWSVDSGETNRYTLLCLTSPLTYFLAILESRIKQPNTWTQAISESVDFSQNHSPKEKRP